MSNAHKGSRLILKDQLVPVDFSSAHFDFNVDATGIQYGNILEQLSGSVYTMRPSEGKFGGGIAIEENTSNLLSNRLPPIFLGAYNGSGYNFGSSTNMQQDKVVVNTPIGLMDSTKVHRINSGVNQSDYVQFDLGTSFSANEVRTYSFYYYGTYGEQINIYMNAPVGLAFSSNGGASINITVPTNQWVRVQFTVKNTTTTTGTYGSCFLVLHNNSLNATLNNTEYWMFSGLQSEQKPFATSFVDGTRISGALSYSKDIINLNSFTVNTWMSISAFSNNSMWQPIFELNHGNHANQRLLLLIRCDTGFNLYGFVGNDSSDLSFSTPSNSVKLSEWQMITFSYDGTTYRIYINGVLSASYNYGVATCTNSSTFNIGSKVYGQLNGVLSDFIIMKKALSDDEIQMIYTSTKPLYNPYDYRSFAY